MKKSAYKDYAKASEYFTDDNELLEKEIKDAEKQKRFIVWVQEFSKKIVVVIFIFYIITSLASLALVYASYTQGFMSGIDTLIAENNATFRDIVGGYIIKAAIENAVKIAGNYYIGITDARLRAMKNQLVKEGIFGKKKVDSESSDYDNNIDSSIEDSYTDVEESDQIINVLDGTSGGDTTL